ncbi:cold shock and DUF1294 domain-containing protein [Candidatus Parabeggiatoa sp. HSG14]|uniref:cold shock and DUF1294 domain-containing protein n=1 Tax=Candidatus Parabeggiatoa sp. HSG14 TaxID=3055593 RepID=UPI0025A80AB4|nr:cold shock and DUF1294 domain-containing protein [Thiotrichales bacterium HSG14]
MEGIIVKFDKKRGFGFIRSETLPKDTFVHIQNVRDQQVLFVGQQVSFNTKQTDKGLSAVEVIPGKKRTSPYYLYGIAAIIMTIATTVFFSYQMGLHIIVAYIASINLSTLLFYGYDKMIAGGSLLRVPEWILHGLSIFGGSPTGLIAQKLFRHKTIKGSFQWVYWTIVVVQIVLLIWLLVIE